VNCNHIHGRLNKILSHISHPNKIYKSLVDHKKFTKYTDIIEQIQQNILITNNFITSTNSSPHIEPPSKTRENVD